MEYLQICPSSDSVRMRYRSAADLLGHLSERGFELAAPVDIDKIAQMLGVEIDESVDLDHLNLVGKISTSEGGATIWINPLENSYIPRKRFTIAHELGHFCLHLDESRKTFADTKSSMNRSESYWDKYESEANNFAAELLMPKELILREGNAVIDDYSETDPTGIPTQLFIDRLAAKLKVSNKAMEYRLKNLGILHN